MSTIDFVKTDCGDLSCHTGVTFFADILVTNQCSGLPADLSGYDAEMIIYTDDVSTDLDTIEGIIDIATGVIRFSIPSDVTEDYEIGLYDYQINVAQGAYVFRLAQGKFEVTQ
jgi:hypothetical protein